jgi:hypothetical protein
MHQRSSTPTNASLVQLERVPGMKPGLVDLDVEIHATEHKEFALELNGA